MPNKEKGMEVRVAQDDTNLRVYYDGFDPDLDMVLTKVLESLGWTWWASGFSHLTSVRDLAFERVSITA